MTIDQQVFYLQVFQKRQNKTKETNNRAQQNDTQKLPCNKKRRKYCQASFSYSLKGFASNLSLWALEGWN